MERARSFPHRVLASPLHARLKTIPILSPGPGELGEEAVPLPFFFFFFSVSRIFEATPLSARSLRGGRESELQAGRQHGSCAPKLTDGNALHVPRYGEEFGPKASKTQVHSPG